MNIYLSAGPSTIAALMAADRACGEWTAGPCGLRAGAGPTLRPIARGCERAVVTAYCDLRTHGADASAAVQACSVLYQSHHPEASLEEARRLVGGWIEHHRL